jgi:uncharacterized protein YjiK
MHENLGFEGLAKTPDGSILWAANHRGAVLVSQNDPSSNQNK